MNNTPTTDLPKPAWAQALNDAEIATALELHAKDRSPDTHYYISQEAARRLRMRHAETVTLVTTPGK